MNTELIALNQEDKAIFQRQIVEAGGDYNAGEIFISRRGDTVIRISRIEYNKIPDGQKDSHAEIAYRYRIIVHYERSTNHELTEWSSYGSEEYSRFHSYKLNEYVKVTGDVQQYMQEAKEVIEGKRSLDSYQDTSMGSGDSSSELLHMGSKASLIALEKAISERKAQLEIVQACVALEMEKRKRELERIKTQMGLILADFQKKIERIQKVIYTISLYLGIDEEIVQIQDGPKATVGEVLHFRQAVAFMDEEVGDVMDDLKGLDFKQISDFDDYLCKKREL